jgi:three-Cys-motif partner protein
LGEGSDWRSVLEGAPPNNRAEALRKFYVQRLKQNLQYLYVEHERISSQGHPLYYLFFCTRSERGAKFWREITQKKRDGQRTFRFD